MFSLLIQEPACWLQLSRSEYPLEETAVKTIRSRSQAFLVWRSLVGLLDAWAWEVRKHAIPVSMQFCCLSSEGRRCSRKTWVLESAGVLSCAGFCSSSSTVKLKAVSFYFGLQVLLSVPQHGAHVLDTELGGITHFHTAGRMGSSCLVF